MPRRGPEWSVDSSSERTSDRASYLLCLDYELCLTFALILCLLLFFRSFRYHYYLQAVLFLQHWPHLLTRSFAYSITQSRSSIPRNRSRNERSIIQLNFKPKASFKSITNRSIPIINRSLSYNLTAPPINQPLTRNRVQIQRMAPKTLKQTGKIPEAATRRFARLFWWFAGWDRLRRFERFPEDQTRSIYLYISWPN